MSYSTDSVTHEKAIHEKDGALEVENLAEKSEAIEHQEKLWTIIKRNPLILLIIAYANLGAFMVGFDSLALSLALSMPSFGIIYGTPSADGSSFTIPVVWQSLWNAMPGLTTMLGAASTGPIADRLGRKWTFGIGALFSVAGVALVYVARSPGLFLAGKMVNGISLGICLTNGQTYVSEVTPLHLRGVALSTYTFSINLGYLIAAAIGGTRFAIITPDGYLNLFASAWAWPGVLLVFMFLIPESPFHLVRKGNMDKARKSLQSLHGKSSDIGATLTSIQALTEAERQESREAADATFMECFRGTNWRRTRIILYCNAIPNMIGIPIVANGPYFMVQAGLATSMVPMMIEIGIAFGIVSSIYTWYFMTRVGRRKIVLTSTTVAAAFLLMMGIAGCFPQDRAASWTVGIALQLLWFCISSSAGPAIATAGEISATRLRAKSQAIGFTFNNLFGVVWNVVTPYIFNPAPSGGGLLGKTGFIFCATSIISIIVFWLEYPETKDRSPVELNEMFEQKVPTRKFKEYKTSGFAGLSN